MSWDEFAREFWADLRNDPSSVFLVIVGLVGLIICIATFVNFKSEFPWVEGIAQINKFGVKHFVALMLFIIPVVFLLLVKHRQKTSSAVDISRHSVEYLLRGIKES